jgi:hypothetical protein
MLSTLADDEQKARATLSTSNSATSLSQTSRPVSMYHVSSGVSHTTPRRQSNDMIRGSKTNNVLPSTNALHARPTQAQSIFQRRLSAEQLKASQSSSTTTATSATTSTTAATPKPSQLQTLPTPQSQPVSAMPVLASRQAQQSDSRQGHTRPEPARVQESTSTLSPTFSSGFYRVCSALKRLFFVVFSFISTHYC